MYRNSISIIVVCFFIIIALGSGGGKTYTPQYTSTTPEKEVSYVNNTNISLVEYTPPNLVRTGTTLLLKKTVYTSSYYADSYDYPGEIKLSNEYLTFKISLTQSSVGNNPVVFDFQIANNSDQVIKVKWDEVTYIDNDGVAHPVIKSGVRLVERAQSTKNIVIPPQSKVDELIHPSDYIDYVEGSYGGWSSKPVLENLEDKQRVKVFMPIDVGGTITNYTFTFEAKMQKINSGEAQAINEEHCGSNEYRFYSSEKHSVECLELKIIVKCKNNEDQTYDYDNHYWICPSGELGNY